MKKNILIFSTLLVTLSIVAFGFKTQNTSVKKQKEIHCKPPVVSTCDLENPFILPSVNFHYDINSRFTATITKEKLHLAKSISDLVPEGGTRGIESFRDVKIGIVSEGNKQFAMGTNGQLNSAQLALLKSADYSTNFYIEAFCKRENSTTGTLEDQCFVYYITIIPEKKAEFKDGHQALMDYLKINSDEQTANVKEKLLKPGKVRFTVTKNGMISNVYLESTSGYGTIDTTMIELITNMPGEWIPATNSNGEKVNQELVFSFGLIGC